MNTEEVISLYETVADITDQMLIAARKGDWEQLAELETRCSGHVEIIRSSDVPRAPLSAAEREKKVTIIKKILAHDREIRTITEPWLTKLAALLKKTGTERKLNRAYGSNKSL